MATTDKINTFSTAMGTGIASYISKKYNLDNPTYMAVTTIITLLVSFGIISGNNMIMTLIMSGLHINKTFMIIIICSSIIACMYLVRYKILLLSDLLLLRKYYDCQIQGKYMIEKFIEYMEHHNNYYQCPDGIVWDNVRIAYNKITKYIYFNDTQYGIKGRILFVHKQMEEEQQQSPPIKTENTDKTKTENTKTENTNVSVNKRTEPKELECVGIKLDRCIIYSSNITNITNITNYISVLSKCTYNDNSTITMCGNEFVMFSKYINSNKKYFVTYKSEFGMNDNSVEVFFPCDTVIQFNDTRFNITGLIKWVRKSSGIIYLIGCDVPQYYSLQQYINDATVWLSSNNDVGGYITQHEVNKIMTKDMIRIMYQGPVMSINELEKKYIQTLFHKDMILLWKRIKTINYYPERIINIGQSPRINLLLHGPPGTGKSTFAYRIAMATRRHLMNIRISKCKKDELLELFVKPKLRSGCTCSPSEVVFVLDEFDQDIDKLLITKKRREEQNDISKEFMNNIFNKSSCTHNENTKTVIKHAQQTAPDNDVSSAMNNANEQLKKVDGIMDGINKMYDKVNNVSDDIIALKDLLTIFQGAVPIDGCIIIAMTNKYDEIRDMCPELFRAGRMTPVKFGNFGTEMLNLISQHYFKREFKTDIQIDVQPSKVLEIVTTATFLDECEQYNYFELKIKELCGLSNI